MMLDRQELSVARRQHEDPPEVGHIRRVVARVALVVLGAAGLYQGIWAQFAPRSFFEDFPGGVSWVAGDGVYNEHLTRDIGGLINGLAVVALVAAWTLSKPLLAANALGWLVYALPHLGYHLAHPLSGSGMQALNVLVLCSQVVLPVLGLLAVSWRQGELRAPARDEDHPQPIMADALQVTRLPRLPGT
jgi:hypothetical protein